MADTIVVDDIGSTICLRINRPDRLNAWTTEMRNELTTHLCRANADPSIKAVVLTGTGDRAFCAGQDLAETQKFVAEGNVEDWIGKLRDFYGAIRNMDKPIVGAVNGLAAGSGFQAVMMMDVVVGHPGVRLGQPEVNSGIPSIFGSWMMTERLGRSRAVELSVTGRMMESAECHRLGLLHHLVDAGQVIGTAQRIAADLALKPPTAMKITKRYLRRANDAAYEAAFSMAEEGQKAAFLTGEPQSVMAEFFRVRRAKQANS